jgi:mannose-6-phosphate isomerase-like protein (cupin superfamily)
MIDTRSFNKDFGKVQHSMLNDWTWNKVATCIGEVVAKTPERYKGLGDGGFACWGFEPYFTDVLQFLQQLELTYQPRAQVFGSADYNSKSFDLHRDPDQHLWIWQVIGSTPWQVEDQEFVLETNEILYMPPNLLHCARPNSPRVSFTFSLEKAHFYY